MSEPVAEPTTRISVRPEPTDVEMAVIMAAFDELWPREPEATAPTRPSTRWRFSGRWWADGVGQRGGPARGWR